MKLGYSPATACVLDLEQAFRLAQALKLEFLELSFELFEVAPETQRPSHVRELARATGIGTTLHLPFTDLNLASIVPRARAVAVERVARALDYAGEVGAWCAVLHTGQNHFFQPVTTQYAREALASSLAELKGGSTPVALENLAVSQFDLVKGPTDLLKVTREAQMANCLDFGHAHVEACRRGCRGQSTVELIQSYIDALGTNVVHLHVHGNDGSGDHHRATCDGTVPFERYASYLREFPGTVCIESAGGTTAVARSVDHMRHLIGVLA